MRKSVQKNRGEVYGNGQASAKLDARMAVNVVVKWFPFGDLATSGLQDVFVWQGGKVNPCGSWMAALSQWI
jgi:hypothetical protein